MRNDLDDATRQGLKTVGANFAAADGLSLSKGFALAFAAERRYVERAALKSGRMYGDRFHGDANESLHRGFEKPPPPGDRRLVGPSPSQRSAFSNMGKSGCKECAQRPCLLREQAAL
jgi:hypothetical protein